MKILFSILGIIAVYFLCSVAYNMQLGDAKMSNDEIKSTAVKFSCSALFF